MSDTLDLIEAIRGTLRDAYKQASTDQDKQKIKAELNSLADFQEQVILQEFLNKAAEVKGLSDLLSEVIQDLQGIISNFFLNNLNDIANRNGLSVSKPTLLGAPAASPIAIQAGNGIDSAKDCTKLTEAIKNAGVEFVGRYYRNASSKYPALSAKEALAISRGGLNIVALWEGASDKIQHFSYSRGVDEGTSAYQQALVAGQGRNTPIYFAVDFDANTAEVAGPVFDYFKGIVDGFNTIATGSPAYRIGVYGSGLVCSWLQNHGMVSHCWLAMSTGWSGFNTFANWNIKQGPNLPTLSFDHDSDSGRPNYGGFRVGP
jgi:hypothetical protein